MDQRLRADAERTTPAAEAERRWAVGPPPPGRARSTGVLRYLLDYDPELADALDLPMRLAARRMATAVVFDADPGEIELGERLRAAVAGPGVLVLQGVLAVNVTVGGRVASELLGTGDLLDPDTSDDDELLTCATDWRGLAPTRFAVLDDGFAQRVARWPQLTQVLLQRAERRTHSLNVQRAIASQPRLEIRLALLLLHLAARWGCVEPGGVRLSLPLTHQLLGRLVGAERPSVSHALARLSRSGLVTGTGDEWHLHARVDETFDAMLDDVPAGVAPLRASGSAR